MYAILNTPFLSLFKKKNNKWFFWTWGQHFYSLELLGEKSKADNREWLPVLDSRLEEVVNTLPLVSAIEAFEFVVKTIEGTSDEERWTVPYLKQRITEGLMNDD